MAQEIRCKHCKTEPGFVKQCVDTGQVYWALECDCKSTPFYRSQMSVIGKWEGITFKQDPEKALKKARESLENI